ncbi:CP2 transcription factor-domain-containing protein [Syncephalis fuscata]|nr:CP2 transcription factor-domain-containing protein [Syncephalis fuscata]
MASSPREFTQHSVFSDVEPQYTLKQLNHLLPSSHYGSVNGSVDDCNRTTPPYLQHNSGYMVRPEHAGHMEPSMSGPHSAMGWDSQPDYVRQYLEEMESRYPGSENEAAATAAAAAAAAAEVDERAMSAAMLPSYRAISTTNCAPNSIVHAFDAFGSSVVTPPYMVQPPTPEGSPNLSIPTYSTVVPSFTPNMQQRLDFSRPCLSQGSPVPLMSDSPSMSNSSSFMGSPMDPRGTQMDMSNSVSHHMNMPVPDPQMRYTVVLDAPTAAAQRVEQGFLTYINKGQYYNLALTDTIKEDCLMETVVRIMFHEKAHRRLASTYWSHWLGQQSSPNHARAIEINVSGSNGVVSATGASSDTKRTEQVNSAALSNENGQPMGVYEFDRVRVRWYGQKGATVQIRLNCLSTEFTRVKGVKGIPMRIHAETHIYTGEGSGNSHGGSSHHHSNEDASASERAFAAVKLFRDKGAERKNKDDMRHREKLMIRMRGKASVSNGQRGGPSIDTLPPTFPVTVFARDVQPFEQAELEQVYPNAVNARHALLHVEPDAHLQRTDVLGGGATSSSNNGNSGVSSSSVGAASPTMAATPEDRQSIMRTALDVDPSYTPRPRTKPAALCIYALIPGDVFYRACYLDELTEESLRLSLCEKLNIQPESVHDVVRKTESGIVIRVEDSTITQMSDEQIMRVSIQLDVVSGQMQMKLEF